MTVLGPAGYRMVITSTQTLSSLAPGSYTINAGAGATTDPIVGTGYAGTVTGSPATVAADAQSDASVTYTSAWRSAGVLWVANEVGLTISGFSSANLAHTGAPAPAVVIGNGTSTSAARAGIALALDDAGGLWESSITDTLRYWTAAQIANSTNAAPRIIVAPSLQSPTALAIDAQGDLWVADQYGNTLNEFTASQIATSGTKTPAVVISAAFGTIMRPWALAFDAHGNLWVGNLDGNSVAGFAAADLTTTGSPLPFAGITGAQGVHKPVGLAFDAQGNLWVGTVLDSLSRFNASDLTTIGSPTPTVILSGVLLQSEYGLAIDNSGALWVASWQTNTLLRYDANHLTTGALPDATISKTGASIAFPTGIAFSPAWGQLPVH